MPRLRGVAGGVVAASAGRDRSALGGELLAVDARPVAGAGAAGAEGIGAFAVGLGVAGVGADGERPAPREREAAVAGRGAGGRQRPASGAQPPVDEGALRSAKRTAAGTRKRARRGGAHGTAAGSASGHGVARPHAASGLGGGVGDGGTGGTELSAVRPGVRGERREDDGADRGAPGREALAPAVLRLFPNTPYGVSVWALFLLEKYAHHRPLRAVSRMLSAHGLDVAPGTLADSLPRFVPLFAPLVAAIAERQAAAHVAHGDETSWTIHARGERGDSPRCWLWVCLTADAVRLRVDPSRSAAAARELFGGLGTEAPAYLVCDRYAAYARLAREEPERFVPALCWAHARRDFVDATAGRPRARRPPARRRTGRSAPRAPPRRAGRAAASVRGRCRSGGRG